MGKETAILIKCAWLMQNYRVIVGWLYDVGAGGIRVLREGTVASEGGLHGRMEGMPLGLAGAGHVGEKAMQRGALGRVYELHA